MRRILAFCRIKILKSNKTSLKQSSIVCLPFALETSLMDNPEVVPQAPGTPLVPSTPPQGAGQDASSTPTPIVPPAAAPETPQAPPTGDPATTPTPAAAAPSAAAAATPAEPPKKALTSVKDVGVSADRNARHRRFMEVQTYLEF